MTGIATITPGNVRVGGVSQAVYIRPAEDSTEAESLRLLNIDI